MLADLQNAVSEDFPVLSGIAYELKTVDDSLKDFLSPAFYLTPPAADWFVYLLTMHRVSE